MPNSEPCGLSLSRLYVSFVFVCRRRLSLLAVVRRRHCLSARLFSRGRQPQNSTLAARKFFRRQGKRFGIPLSFPNAFLVGGDNLESPHWRPESFSVARESVLEPPCPLVDS